MNVDDKCIMQNHFVYAQQYELEVYANEACTSLKDRTTP